MDGSFFAFAVLGLLGYIVGDAQREFRYRRDARANLARSVANLDGNGNTGTNPVANTNGNGNGSTFVDRLERRDARSRAVRGNHNGLGAYGLAARGNTRRTDAASLIGAARDC